MPCLRAPQMKKTQQRRQRKRANTRTAKALQHENAALIGRNVVIVVDGWPGMTRANKRAAVRTAKALQFEETRQWRFCWSVYSQESAIENYLEACCMDDDDDDDDDNHYDFNSLFDDRDAKREREAAAYEARLRSNAHNWRKSGFEAGDYGWSSRPPTAPWHSPFPQMLSTSPNTRHLQQSKSVMPFATTRVPQNAQLLESISLPGVTLQLMRWELTGDSWGSGFAFAWMATNTQTDSWSHVLGRSPHLRWPYALGKDSVGRVFALAPGTTCDLVCAHSHEFGGTEKEAMRRVRDWSFELAPSPEDRKIDLALAREGRRINKKLRHIAHLQSQLDQQEAP